MRILLFGKSGQLGRELQRTLTSLGELVSLGHEESADFAELENLAATVRSIRPDIIVNAAAFTAVDLAEDEPSLARPINAEAPRVLAQEAHFANIQRLIGKQDKSEEGLWQVLKIELHCGRGDLILDTV